MLIDGKRLIYIERIAAENKYLEIKNKQIMVEGYDPDKQNSYILYLDANNLYGWAMSQPLPTGDFRWEDCDKLAESILEHPTDRPEGYILEVALESPKELPEEHNAYPPAPERDGPEGVGV